MTYRKCKYVNGVCEYCGHVPGWRVHRLHRGLRTADCPRSKVWKGEKPK